MGVWPRSYDAWWGTVSLIRALGLTPISSPGSLEGSVDAAHSWIPASHVGDLEWVPGPWLQPGPVPAVIQGEWTDGWRQELQKELGKYWSSVHWFTFQKAASARRQELTLGGGARTPEVPVPSSAAFAGASAGSWLGGRVSGTQIFAHQMLELQNNLTLCTIMLSLQIFSKTKRTTKESLFEIQLATIQSKCGWIIEYS